MRVRAHPRLLPKKSVFEMTETGAGIVVASNSWTEHTALARCEQEGIEKVVTTRRLKSDRLPLLYRLVAYRPEHALVAALHHEALLRSSGSDATVPEGSLV